MNENATDSSPLNLDELCRLISFLAERGHFDVINELVWQWVSRNALALASREPA